MSEKQQISHRIDNTTMLANCY